MKTSTLVILIVILVIPLIGLGTYLSSEKKTMDTPSVTPTPSPSSTARIVPTEADAISAHKVILKTSKGDITITLYPEDAPLTVKNFVTLGKSGYYDNILFHRIDKDFVIQGGDPTGTGRGGESIYGRKFKDEINQHKIVKGTVAMANSGPNTNGSQFYIVTERAQPGLDGGYTVFGKVEDEESLKVVQSIASVPVISERPVDDVKMTGFEIVTP